MEQPKFNTIALIGIVVTLATFGGTFLTTYIRLESRIAVIEYQVTNIREQQTENSANIKALLIPKR